MNSDQFADMTQYHKVPDMKVDIQFINKSQQRYDTCGDWEWDGKTLTIRANLMLDWRKQLLVAIHELVEAALCINNDVSQEVVDEWDFNHPEADEPGELDGCPYRFEHETAVKVERLIAEGFGINFEDYEKELGNEQEE